MSAIRIDEPCHENWAAMTPTQQGAFCGKCQIDVIDFSGKSADEVKLILQENAGKHLCGRFKKTQLDDLNAAYIEWENQSTSVFQSKFLYACLIVFGMTLFSCNTPEEMVVGELTFENNPRVEQVDPLISEEYSNVRETSKEQNYTGENPMYLKGKVANGYVENQQTNCVIQQDTVEEERMIKGEIAFVPEPEYIIGQTTITVAESPHIYDPFLVTPEILIETDSTGPGETKNTGELVNSENQVAVEPENTSTIENFVAHIYPNPTGTITTVVIDIKNSGSYSIELFALNGQKIMNLFSGELSEGKSNHQIDLSVYTPGTYLVKVSSNGQIETYKIIKAD